MQSPGFSLANTWQKCEALVESGLAKDFQLLVAALNF